MTAKAAGGGSVLPSRSFTPMGLQSSREAGAAGDGRSEEILDWIGLDLINIDHDALGVEGAEGWLHDACTRGALR